jgi:sugar transferase (PEP-CTERM system associated)
MNSILAFPQVTTPASSSFPRLRKRLLILGTGRLAQELGQLLVFARERHYEVVGFLDHDPSRVGERIVNPSVIGTYPQLFEIVERYSVRNIAVCLEDRRGTLPLETLLDFKVMGIEVVDGHDMYEEEAGRLSIDLLKPSTLIFSRGFRRRTVSMVCKRAMDFTGVLAALVVLAPILAFFALLIKVDSEGPVIYRQTRVGRHGMPYSMLKFRSMLWDAELQGPRWASEGDPRVTRVGRWLRKWRLDELPQLINVLKGEMSLVGPRPERPIFVQDLRRTIPYYDLRHTVRPGITGWAQIRFRYAASHEDSHVKLQYDLYYLKNLSLALDLRILLESIRVVLKGQGSR